MSDKTALVVDDSRSARYAMRKLLESAGYAVDTAESAQDAYVYLDRRLPGVIFLDHQMPGSDGLDVLAVLKDDARRADIPVVICSSEDGGAFLQRAHDAGAVAVLSKPPDAAQLRALLHRLDSERAPSVTADRGARKAPSLGLPPRPRQAEPTAPATPRRETPATFSAPTPSAAPPTVGVHADITALLARIEALETQVAQLQRWRDEDAASLPSRLLPSLLQALESPVRSRAQRAAAQLLQQAAERMQQDARTLLQRPDPDERPL